MLGSNAYHALRERSHNLLCSGRTNRYQQSPFYALDVADLKAVRELIQRLKPDVVIYGSGIIQKDVCERERDYTQRVHTLSPALIAELLVEWGGKMMYISSDAVYGGDEKETGHRESDPLNPATFYAETKAAGEQACLEANPSTLCCRVTPVGLTPDLSRGTLAEWAYSSLKSQDINGYTNYYFTPISATQLGHHLNYALENNLTGVYNIGCQEVLSKYQFIQLMKERFPQEMTHQVFPSRIPQGEAYSAHLNSDKYYQQISLPPLSAASVINTL